MTDSERHAKRMAECEIAAGLCFLACVALLAIYGLISAGQSLIAWVLVCPEVCDKCHSVPLQINKRSSYIHGHHRDYSKPLEVQWLCIDCHAREHHV